MGEDFKYKKKKNENQESERGSDSLSELKKFVSDSGNSKNKEAEEGQKPEEQKLEENEQRVTKKEPPPVRPSQGEDSPQNPLPEQGKPPEEKEFQNSQEFSEKGRPNGVEKSPEGAVPPETGTSSEQQDARREAPPEIGQKRNSAGTTSTGSSSLGSGSSSVAEGGGGKGIHEEPNVVPAQKPQSNNVQIKEKGPSDFPPKEAMQGRDNYSVEDGQTEEEKDVESGQPRVEFKEPTRKKPEGKKMGAVGERVPTGVRGFDELISGGFERDSTVLLVGGAGTGKTLFGLQFLYEGATKYDEPGVFVSFEEDRNSLFSHAKQFGWDFEKLEKEGKFKLLEFKPHQMTKIIEEGGGSIRDMLAQLKAKRVVVDSITSYGLLFRDEYTRRDKILEFLNSLKNWEVTSLVVSEESPEEMEKRIGSIGYITDAIVSLYYNHDEGKGIRIHSLEIIKMRGSAHTNKLCAMNFEKKGIRVYPDIEVF